MNPLYRNDRAGQYPKSWYAASAPLPSAERPSLFGAVSADVCIVGAGYTGLSAALACARAGLSVVVLDAHRVGFGASGRNGGQVGSGFNKSQRWLAAKLGADTARALWDLAEEGKANIRAMHKSSPDIMFRPGVAHGAYSVAEAAKDIADADYLSQTYGYDQITALDATEMRELVLTQSYQGGVLDMGAGHLHPLRYAFALAAEAEAAGAKIYERAEVHHIAHGDPAKVQTGQGHVIARHVILAGNGYLPGIERKVTARVMPINSFICATTPITDPARRVLARDIAVADSKFVVNYFRMSEDNRLLFGGRESYSIGYPADISTALVQRMVALFPQLAGIGVDYVWGGTLGITMSRLPAIQRVAPNIISGAGFSGHGVSLSGLTGRVMAEAVLGQAGRFDTLAKLPTPAFPGGGAFRAPLLTLAMTWYSLRDRLGI